MKFWDSASVCCLMSNGWLFLCLPPGRDFKNICMWSCCYVAFAVGLLSFSCQLVSFTCSFSSRLTVSPPSLPSLQGKQSWWRHTPSLCLCSLENGSHRQGRCLSQVLGTVEKAVSQEHLLQGAGNMDQRTQTRKYLIASQLMCWQSQLTLGI